MNHSRIDLFEDLITDLQRENLLDNGGGETMTVGGNLFLSGKETTSSFKEISNFHDVSFVATAQVKEILPERYSLEKPPPVNSETADISPLTNYNPVLLLAPVQPRKKLQKVQVKNKKRGRFCRTCLIGVPYYRFRCKFCGEKIGKGILYYLFILFSIAALLTLTYLLLSSKNYI